MWPGCGRTAKLPVTNISPLNIFEKEWRYCKPFSDAVLLNESIYPNFAIKLAAMATSPEESEKEIQIVYVHANTMYLTFCENKIVKIVPVDPAIIGLTLKKEINASKIAQSASLPSWLNYIEMAGINIFISPWMVATSYNNITILYKKRLSKLN